MTMFNVNFKYNLPEIGEMQIDLNPADDREEQEAIAIREIKEVYPDVTDVVITGIEAQ